jgi:hypothetical protein
VKRKVNFIWMMDRHMIIDTNVNSFIVVLHLKIMNFIPSRIFYSSHFTLLFYFRSLDSTAKFETDAWFERIVIIGYPKNPTKVTIHSGDKQAIPLHRYLDATQMLIIRRPGPPVSSDWTLTIS